MLVEDVAEEFQRHGSVRLALQSAANLLQQRDVRQRRLAEQALSRGDVGLGKGLACRRDLHVAFMRLGKAQQHRVLDDGEQIVDFHQKIVGQVVEVLLAAAIIQQLEQAGHAARLGVWQPLNGGLGRFSRRAGGASSSSGCVMTL